MKPILLCLPFLYMIYAVVVFFFFFYPFAKEPFGNVSFTLLDLSLS